MIGRVLHCCGLFFHFLGVSFQMVRGAWKILRMPQPIVTIFGGARLKQDDFYAKQTHQLGHRLVQENISVMTGGGPGIMEAANCGAFHEGRKELRSVGVGVEGLDIEKTNQCAQEFIAVRYFFARKWLLTRYSVAYVVMPGGFGTLDEFAEVMTLMQTRKLPGVPIVMIGVDYWQPLITWVKESALKHRLISEADLKLFMVTDDLEEAVRVLKTRCQECMGV